MKVQSLFVRIHEERGLSVRGTGGLLLGRFLVAFLIR